MILAPNSTGIPKSGRFLGRGFVYHRISRLIDRFPPVFAMGFDADLGSRRGTVVESEATYINPCIRAFRSDGAIRSFPQAGLKAALEAWLAPSYSATGWAYDIGANGYDAVQAVVANQPTIATAGAVNVDALGNLALGFDGSNGKLEIAHNAAFNFTSDFAVFAVFEIPSGATGYDALITKYENGGGYDWLYLDGQSRASLRGTSSILPPKIGTDVRGSTVLATWVASNSASTTYINGASNTNTAGTWTPTTTNNDVLIGDRALTDDMEFGGDIVCMLVFSGDMSAQRPAIEAALAKTYGITLAS